MVVRDTVNGMEIQGSLLTHQLTSHQQTSQPTHNLRAKAPLLLQSVHVDQRRRHRPTVIPTILCGRGIVDAMMMVMNIHSLRFPPTTLKPEPGAGLLEVLFYDLKSYNTE